MDLSSILQKALDVVSLVLTWARETILKLAPGYGEIIILGLAVLSGYMLGQSKTMSTITKIVLFSTLIYLVWRLA